MWRTAATVLTCVGLTLPVAVSAAPRPVPPQDCGFMSVKSKRFNVKADQLRCEQARKYVRRYETGQGKPKGYTCQAGDPDVTSIAVRCFKGKKEFFAIRRD